MALTELEDTEWFPDVLRDQQLGYIGWLVQVLDMYRPIHTLLPKWVSESKLSHLKDLCSGSGEPMISLSNSLSEEIEVTLSDKFPPLHSSLINAISYLPDSEDVLKVNFEPHVYYTMFNAFHHFDDNEQREIVNSMIAKAAPFCFVEILEPSFMTLLKVVFANTIGQFLLAPFVQPFSFKRLIFTYVLPINLFTTTYDGIISVLKSKNKKQYQTLLQQLPTDNYKINIESRSAPYFNNLIVIQGFQVKPIQL